MQTIQVPSRTACPHFEALLDAAGAFEPVPAAVVHPCDEPSLRGALEAARGNLIRPILIGPEDRIRHVAGAAGLDIEDFRIESTPHSHASAARAVELVRAGTVGTLLKGALHTDELLGAVVDHDRGLRTERRISHIFAMDVPTYPKPLFLTDGAINIAPDLMDKRDIVQNAIDLAHAAGIASPRVAILSAVETVNPKIVSTIEAAALCKMADRGQITGAALDGPLAFDNAISVAAAAIKGVHSRVAGHADILVVPDLMTGNMLAKQLVYMASAQSAGVALGARVPIALTSRSDGVLSRVVSCALARLFVRSRTAALS